MENNISFYLGRELSRWRRAPPSFRKPVTGAFPSAATLGERTPALCFILLHSSSDESKNETNPPMLEFLPNRSAAFPPLKRPALRSALSLLAGLCSWLALRHDFISNSRDGYHENTHPFSGIQLVAVGLSADAVGRKNQTHNTPLMKTKPDRAASEKESLIIRPTAEDGEDGKTELQPSTQLRKAVFGGSHVNIKNCRSPL